MDFPARPRSRSLGMITSESTCFFSSRTPASALARRSLPSRVKGLVTTPTVRAPISLATSAMTGAAPVPVPPPRPAAMKIMSAPDRTSASCSRFSAAASLPTEGSAPAPSPLVSCDPICILTGAFDMRRAWASVFATIKSIPCNSQSIMVLTAFPPPPPTPITLIFALWSMLSSNSNMIYPLL